MFWCTTIICVCFSTPIETSPKHGFWTLQQKIVDHAFLSWCAGIKKSLGAKSGLYGGWPINKASSLVRFSNFSEDFRQTNCGVLLRIDRPTLLKWNSRHMTSFAAETGRLQKQSALLRRDFATNNFRWICLVIEDPYGEELLCFRFISTDLWFVTYDGLINVFSCTAIEFF